MKKILLTMGTIASVATPVAAVVSCGSKTPAHTNPGTQQPGDGTPGTPGTPGPDGGTQGGGGSQHHIHGMHINVARITRYKTTAAIVPITSEAFPDLNNMPAEAIAQIASGLSANTIAMDSSELIFKIVVTNEVRYYILNIQKGQASSAPALDQAFDAINQYFSKIPADVGGTVPTVTLDEINGAITTMPNNLESIFTHSALYAKGAIRNGNGASILRHEAGIQHDWFEIPNGMEVSFTVKAPLAISGSNFTLEAKLFSLADPTIFATHDIDVASLSDAQGAALVDLTQAREGVWHALFRNGLVRRLPNVDQTLFVDIDGTNYGFTWTAADATHETPTGFMHNGEHDQHHTQKDMLNYLAQRIVAANPGAHLDALRIFRAFGVTYHGLQYEITTSLEALQNVPTTGLKAGVTLPVTRAKMFDFSEEANRGTGIHWHEAFRGESEPDINGKKHFVRMLPFAGSTIWVRLGNRDYGFTWTNDDTDMQVMRDFLAFKNSGSQDHVASYIAQRIKAANPSMSQTPQDIFNAMGLVGLPGKHGTSYIATPHAGMPTEGVKAGVHLPYEFDADFAKFEQVSTKTMVDIKTAVDASNQASSPVPLTTTLLGMKDPSLTSGITVKGFKVPSYTTGVVNVEVSLQYEKTTFTRTIKLTPSDLPYDFTTDIALMRAATLTSTLSGGDLNSALVATPPPTKVELHLTGEPTFTDGTTVTYTGRGNLSGTTSTVTAILTNGKFTQNVTGIIITTA